MVDLNAEVYSSKVYFKDKLRLEFDGTDASNSLSGTALREQTAGDRDINLMNVARFLKSIDNNHITFNLHTQYRERSENALVTDPSENTRATQDIKGKYFFNNFSVNYTLRLGKKWILATNTRLDYLYRGLNSSLEGLSFSSGTVPPAMDNNLNLQFVRPEESLTLEFSHKKFKANLWADIRYQYTYCNALENKQHHDFSVNPQLRLSYTFGPRFRITANASYFLTEVDEQSIYDGLIMTNYKYLTQGRTRLTSTPQWSADISLDFNEPISGWAADIMASYSASESFQSTRYFIDDYIVNVMSNDITDYSTYAASLSLSKTFLNYGAKINVDFDFFNTSSTLNQNGIDYLYTGQSYYTALGFSVSPASWLGIRYSGTYSYDRYSTDGEWNGSGNHTSTQDLRLSFFPVEELELSVSGEYYLDKASGWDLRQTAFLDATISYAFTDKIRAYIKAWNLTDSRTYSYSLLMPLQSVYYEYSIRPLNVTAGVEVRF